VHIKNYLQKDVTWQKLLKAPGTPIWIPDVMKKYSTIHCIIHKLAGMVLDDGNTVLKVSRVSSKACDDSSLDIIQNHICEAMGIEQSWVDDGLDTLKLVDLYGENAQNYKDLRVVKMLAHQGTEGQPHIQLLDLLRRCHADFLRDSMWCARLVVPTSNQLLYI
jgi:hypothetical protein